MALTPGMHSIVTLGTDHESEFDFGTDHELEFDFAKFTRFLQANRRKDPHHHFKMLLIGETGSGKTSFLNLLYNCGTVRALGSGFDSEALNNLKKINNIKLENAQALPMESKTSDATLYNVEVGELRVGVIDTPGFGDSRGFEQDKKNVERIFATLKSVDYINCVCLIINGRQARATASLKYVLTEITAILPKDILNNVIVVFTNTSDLLELTFDPTILKDYLGKEVKHIFIVENPYCKFERAKANVGQLGIDRVKKSLKKAFEEATETLNDICEAIKKFPGVHTLRFIKLYKKKQEIERSVLISLTAYDNQISLEEDLKKVTAEVDAAVKLKTLNKDFYTEQRFKKWVVDETNGYHTLCAYKGCHGNCHKYCTLPKSLDKEIFKDCVCMGPGGTTCVECGHDYTYHYHEEALFREEEVVKQLISDNMKERFETAENDEERAKMVYNKIKDDLQKSKEERQHLSQQLFYELTEFETLGAARNYAKLIENQLAVIQTHLDGTTVPAETDYLRKIKAEMEKKLKLICAAKSGKMACIYKV